jgi:hypothetical protein
VRKQYHFWPGESGLDAWDVDRLVALSRDLQGVAVDVSTIADVDTVYWFDDVQTPTVRRIVEHMSGIEEVDVAYPIMDGMRRIARAMLEGKSTIPAVRLERLPEPDYCNCRPADLPYD